MSDLAEYAFHENPHGPRCIRGKGVMEKWLKIVPICKCSGDRKTFHILDDT